MASQSKAANTAGLRPWKPGQEELDSIIMRVDAELVLSIGRGDKPSIHLLGYLLQRLGQLRQSLEYEAMEE